MRYCIMCGGNYRYWKYPKQLSKINGETLIERTVRLLKECGVDSEDIYITASMELRDILLNKEYFPKLPARIHMKHNSYDVDKPNHFIGSWADCFTGYLEPTTFLMGDVVFSPTAIKTIVETETDDIEFFASAPPFAKTYCKPWAEPFAFKVVDYWHLRQAKFLFDLYTRQGKFKRQPIAWEFWQVVKGTEFNKIDYTNYTVINDYTCDIDKPEDIYKFEGGEEWTARRVNIAKD